mgnify:CR=1 FL=1
MWLGRTPNVSLGDKYKTDGLFRSEKKHITPEEFVKNCTDNADYQKGLLKLAWLLAELREAVRSKSKDDAAVLVCLGKGKPLEVHPMQQYRPEPLVEILRRFWTLPGETESMKKD